LRLQRKTQLVLPIHSTERDDPDQVGPEQAWALRLSLRLTLFSVPIFHRKFPFQHIVALVLPILCIESAAPTLGRSNLFRFKIKLLRSTDAYPDGVISGRHQKSI
jgi:hypothetical protein